MENQDRNDYKVGGILFAGCMFLGMGIGKIFDEAGTGMLIGMGIGFLASALLSRKR